MTDDTMTAAEAAEFLGLSIDKIYRRINRGDIPARLVRDRVAHYQICRRDLEEYRASGRMDQLGRPRIDDQSMIGVPEVARRTGFTVETIRRMCYEGRLPYLRGSGPRGHLRIPVDAVELLMQQ